MSFASFPCMGAIAHMIVCNQPDKPGLHILFSPCRRGRARWLLEHFQHSQRSMSAYSSETSCTHLSVSREVEALVMINDKCGHARQYCGPSPAALHASLSVSAITAGRGCECSRARRMQAVLCVKAGLRHWQPHPCCPANSSVSKSNASRART